MIRVNELKGQIVSCGLTQKDVANRLGISDRAFRNRLKKGIFTNNEIQIMIELLDIKNPMDIFFAPNVT